MSDFDWSVEACDRLRKLWGEGLSTQEIGRRMGVSKNGIVGKAHRLGLPSRPSPILLPTAEMEAARRKAAAARLGREAVTLPPIALPSAPVVAVPTVQASPPPSPPPAILLVRPCRWPLWGDRERPTHRYCDAPQGEGWLPYCPPHQREAKVGRRSETEIDAEAPIVRHRTGFHQVGWGR